MLRYLFAAVMAVTATLVAIGARQATADIPIASISGSFNAPGTYGRIQLGGQSTCAVVIGGTGAGMSIVPTATNDNWATTNITSSINSGSAITTNGNYSGSITPSGLNGIELVVGSISSGMATFTITCSPAVASSIVGSLTIPTPLPVVVPTVSPYGVPGAAVMCPTPAAPIALNGADICSMDANGRLLVTTPAPVATGAHGAVIVEGVGSGTVIPVTTPAPNPSDTITSRVAVTEGSWTVYPTPNPTSSPTSIKASAGVLGGASFWNGTGSTVYIGFYNLATGSVTLGSTVATAVLACPTLTFCFLPVPPGGLNFGTAITYLAASAMTGGVPTTAVGLTLSELSVSYR